MPRKKATKRADGRYVSTLVVGTDANGKLERKFFYSSISQADAKKKRDEYKAAQTAKGLLGIETGAAKRVLLKDWAQKWLIAKEAKVKSSSFDTSYRRPTERYIIPALGHRPLSQIKPIEIETFLNELGKKYSESVMQKTKICLNGIFDSAIDNDICYKNPAKNADAKSDKRPAEKRTYTKEQTASIRAFAKTDASGIYILILLDLGLRCSELCGLKWSDFDFKQKIVAINRAATDDNGHLVVDIPKTDRSRRINPLSTELCNELAKHPDANSDRWVVPSSKNPDIPVNPKNFSAKRYKSFWKRYLQTLPEDERSKFPLLTPHELRHTCGTLRYDEKKNIHAVSKYLGHSTIAITSKYYLHDDIESLRESLGIE